MADDAIEQEHSTHFVASDKPIEQDRGVEQPKSKEIKKQGLDKIVKMPALLKAIIIKIWFSGAVYLFFGWSIAFFGYDRLDMMVVIGAVIGLATDIIANRIALGLDNKKNKMPLYLMWHKKKWYYIIINVLYSIAVVVVVASIYYMINRLIIDNSNLDNNSVPFGIEPFLFGVFYCLVDISCCLIRNFIVKIVKK